MNGDNNGGNTLLDYVNTFGRTAGQVYTAINPPSSSPVVPAAAPQQRMNWTPFAIGVLVLLVIVLALFTGRK